MKVELLHIQECPNWRDAGHRLEAAIAMLGVDALVHYRLLSTVEDIDGTPFSGSPTLVADGEDLFPDAPPLQELACRVFRTPVGLRGLPEQQQVTDALRRHVESANPAEAGAEGGGTR